MSKYKLKLEIFEGPLDLLLYLIKKDDIDIQAIPIVSITEQYMEYIEMMKLLDLDIVGDFLVMAATLMHIKSRTLLPPDPVEVEEQEEDPLDELQRRLLEYKRFKEIAEDLQEKELEMKDYFPRTIDEQEKKRLHNDAKEVYIEANLFDLITAFSDALRKIPEQHLHEIVTEEFTVEDKRNELRHLLEENDTFVLNKVFSRARSKVEIVVTFLAILELIRLQEVKIVQREAFSDIEVIKSGKVKEVAEDVQDLQEIVSENENFTSEEITVEVEAEFSDESESIDKPSV